MEIQKLSFEKAYDLLRQQFSATLFVCGKYEPRRWKTPEGKKLRKVVHNCESLEFRDLAERTCALKLGLRIHPRCSCGNMTNLKSDFSGFRLFCSKKCAAASPVVRQKTQKTLDENYGGHFSKNKDWQQQASARARTNRSYEKASKTFTARYGVTNRFQLRGVKQKIQATLLERYGVDNPLKSEVIRQKITKTCLERYGVEHPMQHPEVFERCHAALVASRYRRKKFTFPSGRCVFVQGYEPQVLNYLLLCDICETEIFTERDKIPVILYTFSDRVHAYYPDIFLPKLNTLIEVKSSYTWKSQAEQNLAKQAAAQEEGYRHFIIIWNPADNCILQII